MKKALSHSVVVLFLSTNFVVAHAGPPSPEHSSIAVTGQGSACQFRFRSDGGLDELTVRVTVRNVFLIPTAQCSTTTTLVPVATTAALCACEPLKRSAITNADGAAQFTFAAIGGRGGLDVRVSTHCLGNIGLGSVGFDFTSPDLDASCEPEPASAVDVTDLALWAGGLPPGYAQASDYDCDGTVGVADLAIWAGGLGLGCSP